MRRSKVKRRRPDEADQGRQHAGRAQRANSRLVRSRELRKERERSAVRITTKAWSRARSSQSRTGSRLRRRPQLGFVRFERHDRDERHASQGLARSHDRAGLVRSRELRQEHQRSAGRITTKAWSRARSSQSRTGSRLRRRPQLGFVRFEHHDRDATLEAIRDAEVAGESEDGRIIHHAGRLLQRGLRDVRLTDQEPVAVEPVVERATG